MEIESSVGLVSGANRGLGRAPTAAWAAHQPPNWI